MSKYKLQRRIIFLKNQIINIRYNENMQKRNLENFFFRRTAVNISKMCKFVRFSITFTVLVLYSIFRI